MALQDVLSDHFITFVAKRIGRLYRSFFTELHFESHEIDHFEHGKNDVLLEINLHGLREWRKKDLKKVPDEQIPELIDFILDGLTTIERKDILDDIQSAKKTPVIEEIIDLMSVKLTKDSRRLMFSHLQIPHDDVDAVSKVGKTLKQETTDILQKWYKEQVVKHWKYQELLEAFQFIGDNKTAGEIKEKYIIKEREPELTKLKEKNDEILAVQNISTKPVDELNLQEKGTIICQNKRRYEIGDEDLIQAKKTKPNEVYVGDEYQMATEGSLVQQNEDESSKSEEEVSVTIELRKYQKELAEVALKGKNTIVCAVTNSGKTVVAFYVIKEHLAGNPKAKVVFFAQTNPLLNQQYNKACEFLKFLKDAGDIVKFTVGQEISEETNRQMFDKGRLFFMTPQSLLNRLNKEQKFPVDICTFSMIIFDECHHVHGKTPYNDVMAVYREAKYKLHKTDLPQIVGLTASPGTDKAVDEKSATDHLLKMMSKMDVVELSTIRRNREELRQYTADAEKEIVSTKTRIKDTVGDKLMNTISEVERLIKMEKVTRFLHQHRPDTEDLIECLEKLPVQKLEQVYTQWLTETRLIVERFLRLDEYIPRLLLTTLRHLEIYAGCLEMNSLLDIGAVTDMMKSRYDQEAIQSEKANTTEEKLLIEKLKNLLEDICNMDPSMVEQNPDVITIIRKLEDEYEKQGENSRFLIFVKTRATAQALAKRLRDVKDLNCQYFTGSQVSTEDGGLTQREQNEIVDKFRNGSYKCIVATKIASEGIDIPECNLVIKYKIITNEIESEQMRGRIRREGKDILIGSDKESHRELINVGRQLLMKQAVEKVSQMTENDRFVRISTEQKKLFEYEEAQRLKTLRQTQQKVTEEFEVYCRKCSQIIVPGHNLRTLNKSLHVVFDNSVIKKVKKEPIKPIITEDINLTHKVFGECGHEWGHINIYNDCKFIGLAQAKIKIYSVKSKTFLNIKKWKDVPYKIHKIEDEELTVFKAEQLESNE